MRTTAGAIIAGILALSVHPSFLEAQRRSGRVRAAPEVGLRAGRDFSVDTWTAGFHARIPLTGSLDLRPNGDLSLDDPGEDFQLNADLALRGPRDQAYLGAGLGYLKRDFDSGEDAGTGLNLFVGFKPIPRPGMQIYVEGRWTFVESETVFRLGFGVTIPL
jgi:hypothetical protein